VDDSKGEEVIHWVEGEGRASAACEAGLLEARVRHAEKRRAHFDVASSLLVVPD
jgi:hypothetical protein